MKCDIDGLRDAFGADSVLSHPLDELVELPYIDVLEEQRELFFLMSEGERLQFIDETRRFITQAQIAGLKDPVVQLAT